jgi:hypothetical protein
MLTKTKTKKKKTRTRTSTLKKKKENETKAAAGYGDMHVCTRLPYPRSRMRDALWMMTMTRDECGDDGLVRRCDINKVQRLRAPTQLS